MHLMHLSALMCVHMCVCVCVYIHTSYVLVSKMCSILIEIKQLLGCFSTMKLTLLLIHQMSGK